MENLLISNLKKAQLKVTPQRVAIYSYLLNTNSHPSAETIYNELKPMHPSMSLATVYKNVAVLRDSHLITEFNVGEDSHRYDANVDFHSHLVCKCCHNVYDFFGEIEFNKTISDLKDNFEFYVEDQNVIFYGICKNCIEHIKH